jgi:hypothetical protein
MIEEDEWNESARAYTRREPEAPMTPEEAYEEALRRIRKAKETGADELDLIGIKAGEFTGLKTLNRLPRELANLTLLQFLYLGGCMQLSGDLSPLAGLTNLRWLNLANCNQLSGDLSPLACRTKLEWLILTNCNQLSGDLSPLAGLSSLQLLDLTGWRQLSDGSPLAGLTKLQSLGLSGCTEVRKFASLEPILPQLQHLYLYDCRFDDLPSEICGQNPSFAKSALTSPI